MPKKQPENKASKIINKSGNKLLLQTAKFFEEKLWDVNVAPYYLDPITGKPREIDIIVKKKFPVSAGRNGIERVEEVTIRLFIECKYLNEEATTVLWLRDKNLNEAKKLVINNSVIGNDETKIPILTDCKHHQLNENKVIKLSAYADNDPISSAIGSTLNSLAFFRKQYTDYSYYVDFPIIIIDPNGNLFAENSSNQNGYEQVNEPL